jgi:RNA-directed DNA polymerase
VIAQAQNTPLEKVRVLQRSLYRAAKANPTRKFGVLYDKVCRYDVLRNAYVRVKANGGAPGVDRQTFELIEKEIGVDKFVRNIQEQLLRRRYRPLPVRRVYIPKSDGAKRPLGIPTVSAKCAVIQH